MKSKDKRERKEAPVFSWEQPIERIILKFVRDMATEFEKASFANKETGWFANNRFSEDCATMAKAYRTVEDHILREIEIRSSIKQP